ncbi:hypothetical protein ASG01_14350 [Chryseobacterium sp. Leaf180]|uniref:sensor histidine kinase n=1 Tax=Chryseobacterium sp. Leaf180 TaxID=1736289 RepID=UPI00070205B0|nr:HAMP domain-containing sensor histidine kinase [Chryseobacterium sp. Leaf180]KQR91067.1 hypothetical protein ASG01_14350 [Chryseobacterium sp. Leaf180]
MKENRNFTVTAYSVSLLFLLVLQGYLLYNSYRLEEKDLNRQAKIIAEKTHLMMENSEIAAREDLLVADFERLQNGATVERERLVHPEKFNVQKLKHSEQLENILKRNLVDSPFRIAMKNEIYSIYDQNTQRELLPKGSSIVLFQSTEPMKNPLILQEGTWSSRHSRHDSELNTDEHNFYMVQSKSTYEVVNLNLLVLRKILPLIAVSMLIIALLIILFRNSVRNLNRQQQKVRELHTTIDSIAHELNTPITTLKFSVAAKPNDPSKPVLERQIKRLEQIVSSIHGSSADDILLTKEDAEFYFDELKKRFDHLHFKINLHLNHPQKLMLHDFKLIIDNLTDNSSKYGAHQLLINIESEEKALKMDVSDDGIGIPASEMKSVFERYYRVTRKTHQHVTGLGMGLYLVRKTVEKYQGKTEFMQKERGVQLHILIPNEA